MNRKSNLQPFMLVLIAGVAGISAVSAQPAPAASALPGGATSLQETYDDWSVSCSQPGGQKICSLSQQQVDGRSRRRVLAMELNTTASNRVEGLLVLPFGLSFEHGITLQIDDSAAGPVLRFRTCLASGCLVPVSFDAKAIASLRKAAAIKVRAVADGGQEIPLSISLKGFAGAHDRTTALTK